MNKKLTLAILALFLIAVLIMPITVEAKNDKDKDNNKDKDKHQDNNTNKKIASQITNIIYYETIGTKQWPTCYTKGIYKMDLEKDIARKKREDNTEAYNKINQKESFFDKVLGKKTSLIFGNRVYETDGTYIYKYTIDNTAEDGKGHLLDMWNDTQFNQEIHDENTENYKLSIRKVLKNEPIYPPAPYERIIT